jgi:hypothetical protein
MAFMKTIIRGRKEALYFCRGEWVSQRERAQGFLGVADAVNICQKHGLRDVDIVLQAGQDPDPSNDLHFPFKPRRPRVEG